MRDEKGQFKKTGIIKECLKCHKSFYIAQSLKKQKFCSMDCRMKDFKGYWLGKKRSKEDRLKMGGARPNAAGEKHFKWIKDRTKVKRYGERRDNPVYDQWRHSVLLRDGFKCRIGNKTCNGKLEVHHILSWSKYPELRYEIKNGITLCHFHHPKKRAEEERLSPFFNDLIALKY